jgi:HAE1 family hydrophobic/amphiphilic exporter-1
MASGAGSVARQIMGTAVIGGMLAASSVDILLVPALFHLVEKWSSGGKRGRALGPVTPSPTPGD